MRVNKTDRNDARGLAELASDGLVPRSKRQKHGESIYTFAAGGRRQAVELRRDVENQMRSLLKVSASPGNAGIKALLQKRSQ
jgi:hypothetical protein